MSTIRLNVSQSFHNKTNRVGGKGEFGNSFYPAELKLSKLVEHIRAGRAFTLGVFQGNTRRKDTFVSSQLLGLDLDEGDIPIGDLTSDPFIKQYAFLVYPTPSSTPEHPKSRVLFCLDEPVTEYKAWEALQLGLMNRFYSLKPDPACKDAARLFFGSDLPGAGVNLDNVLPLEVVSKLSPQQRLEPSNNGEIPSEVVADIVSALGVNTYNRDGWSVAFPCPFQSHEHDDKNPAAHWHQDKHILSCFKCGQFYLAKDVAERLDLTWPSSSRNGRDMDSNGHGPVKPTDDELGEQLIQQWASGCVYLYGQWHRYQDGYWQPDSRIALEFWRVMIANKGNGIRPTQGKATSIEGYMKLKLLVEDYEIEESNRYINLQNGLFNLDTYELEPHRPDLYMTSQLPFAYDPDAHCPTFTKFIHQVLVTADTKEPDYQLRDLAQEAMGYSLTADTSHRVSFWLVGESGAGKSRFLEVLINLAGNSHVTIDLDEMSRNSYQIADIAGKRLVTFTEPDSRSVLADSHYKRLVSQDVIMARQIHGKPFRFIPCAKLWGAMNDTPRVVDRSDAVFNRVMIIPFNYAVPADKRDPRLGVKLAGELPGIFNWALAGLKRLRDRGKFSACNQVERAREEYRSENDTEKAFVLECCEMGTHSATGQELYDAYNAWCKRNGVLPKSSVKVSKDWKRMGFTRRRSNGFTWYDGIQVKKVFSTL